MTMTKMRCAGALFLSILTAACVTSADQDPQASSQEPQRVLPGSPVFDRVGARPMIDFAGVQRTLGGEPTRVLVLGTRHLNNLPEDEFDPADLSLLLDRLEAFSPDIIAIEAVGGRTCDEIQRYEALYPGAQAYCRDTGEALAALDMTRPEATIEYERMLATWPPVPAPAERRRLALLYYGAGEPWSAILQWTLLDPSERVAADGLTDELVGQLDRGLRSRNENRLIGIELATRLDIQQLTAMDDHSADYIYSRSPESLGPAIQNVWQTEHPRSAEFASRKATPTTPGEVIDDYRFQNSEALQRYTIESDFGLAAAMPGEDAVARQYVGWWQVRGLRMAANVLEAAASRPGARVLVIVGASHKAYFDAYLDQMHDVELVSVDSVLRGE